MLMFAIVIMYVQIKERRVALWYVFCGILVSRNTNSYTKDNNTLVLMHRLVISRLQIA